MKLLEEIRREHALENNYNRIVERLVTKKREDTSSDAAEDEGIEDEEDDEQSLI